MAAERAHALALDTQELIDETQQLLSLADKIAVRTLTADLIAGATITGYEIAGSTITGAHIQANSIYADRIQVGGGQSLTSWMGSDTTKITCLPTCRHDHRGEQCHVDPHRDQQRPR